MIYTIRDKYQRTSKKERMDGWTAETFTVYSLEIFLLQRPTSQKTY